MKMSVSGLILAAGESRRMGRPKPLLEYQGRTFIETLIALFAPRCGELIVVLGHEAERVQREIPATSLSSVRIVFNPAYHLGMTTSLQAGLRALSPSSAGVLMTLVDHPAVLASTLDALLAEPRPLLRLPCYQGRRGHPIWFGRTLAVEFLALSPDQAAREVVRAHEADLLDLEDPGIVADIDAPEDYARLTTG